MSIDLELAGQDKAAPQGLDEWIERNELLSIDAAVEFVVTVEDLRAYLSGMEIVPIVFFEEVKEELEYWINRADTRQMSESEYKTWLALGHQSKTMAQLREYCRREGARK